MNSMLTQKTLDVSEYEDFSSHERVLCFEDESVGLKAIIAIHNTNLGSSFGGCRVYNYERFDDAVTDALRLSKGMTYKSALAGLPFGGGKAVILADPRTQKTADTMRAFGEAVETLSGAYITAEDVGSTDEDMITISKATSYVSGLPKKEGVLGGNPSPYTAEGVFYGMRAGLKTVFGADTFDGVHVVVKGLGSVGYDLCRALDKAGAKLTVTDINQVVLEKAQREFKNITLVDPTSAHEVACDVLAPCALGGSINVRTLPDIKAKLIAGAANNQLQNKLIEQKLHERNIVYAPDYVVNAGGIIAVGYEYFGYNDINPFPYSLTENTLEAHISRIGSTTQSILDRSVEDNHPTGAIADQMAEDLFLRYGGVLRVASGKS